MDDSEIKTRVTVTPSSPRLAEQGEQCLVLIHPPGANLGRRFVLDRSFISIGRESSNDIVLDRDSVSRRHARIAVRNGERVLVDLGSTNGTYVNDRQIQEHRLYAGDQIKVGNFILKYLSGQDVEQAYHEEIYKMTIIDALTEVYNKRYFMESVERELARAKRYGRDLTLIMFDIDHFKQINDTFGHLAGDQILKDLAQLVKVRTRSEEIVARYGGEEFAVLVPETSNIGAAALAEQLRKLVEAHQFMFENEAIPVTISLGVASAGSADVDMLEFIKAADERLYTAKHLGRNRVAAEQG
jgi:two-component system, cell cycle response regulator